jgi:diguanylate cyclase (GGDEF)-like protein
MLQFLLGAFGAAAVTIGWRLWARRAGPRTAEQIDRAPDRTSERRTPRGIRASTLMALRDPVSIKEEPPGLRDLPMGEVLHGFLADCALQHGAEHGMLWMRLKATAQFVPVASSQSWNPVLEEWGTPQQRAIVEFAANEVGIVSFDDATRPTLASVRVALEAVGSLFEVTDAAVLVLHAPRGFSTVKAAIKPWMLRHSARLSQMIELQQTHGSLSRQNRRLRGLFRSAEDLETPGTDDVPEQRIIDGMLDASGASFAALVRWDADARQGRVRRVTTNYPHPQPEIDAIVTPESLVGGVCRDGVRQLWSDARVLVGHDLLYGPGSPVPPVGSLAIQPLIRKTTLLGAVVVGATEPNALRKPDLKTIGLMGTLAASALEAVWEIDSVKTVAMTDPLTGLWNRRYFDESLAREGLETDRDGGSFALVIADIDHFKLVNDTHGHEAGDAVLRAVAGALRDLVRTTDVCARIGGEELCIILRQTELEGALELAGRVRQSIEALTVRFQGKELRVTASFGVAAYAAQGGDGVRGRLFKEADAALYRAKAGGRNQVVSAR